MEAKLKLKQQGSPINLPVIIQEYGARWLMERADANGFSVSTSGIRVDGYRQHRLFKGKGKQPITFSTVDITGILSVTVPDVFIEKCLFRGLGPAKGFGCGLMLVRKV